MKSCREETIYGRVQGRGGPAEASVESHEVAGRLGISVATLSNWTRRQRVAAPVKTGAAAPTPIRRPATELEAEVSRLRRELASAKLDMGMFRKAKAYFVKGAG
jgi:transposase